MKYIRTENGVYEVKKEEIVCGVKFYDYETEEYLNRIREEHIIAQADTIEELCDEFVIENDYCGQISQSRYFDFEVAKQNIDIASNDVIYGALRIAGKGLIYVAKMNEEGALVLR